MILEPYIKELLDSLEEKFSLVPKAVRDVYNIAKRYYGEDRVQLTIGYKAYCKSMYESQITYCTDFLSLHDNAFPLQTGFWSVYGLLIHFPEVTVTNEMDQSTVIYDFFARVPLTTQGSLSSEFRFVKTTYTEREIKTKYMHSHCHSIDLRHPEHWEIPCLGNGPIRNTVASLIARNDLQKWTLFFWELDKYTQVESLTGVPYLRLRDLGTTANNLKKVSTFNIDFNASEETHKALMTFVRSYLSTDLLKISIVGGKASLEMPFLDWLVELTKYYKKWEQVATKQNVPTLSSYIREYVVKDNIVYDVINHNVRVKEGLPMLNFKGKQYSFTIKRIDEGIKRYQLLSVDIACNILKSILNYIDCCYAKTRKFSPRRDENNICKGKLIEVSV